MKSRKVRKRSESFAERELVSHLSHIDANLAERVAKGLGLGEKVWPAQPAREARADLKPSKALSIIENGPKNFAGRKAGILVTDGTDHGLFDALKAEVEDEGATVEIVAPTVGGVKASDGSLKVFGYAEAAMPLFEKAGIAADMDDGLSRSPRPRAQVVML
jgi:hypothetical protein